MILAIDLGSTSFKAAVVTPEGRQLGTGSAPLAYVFGPNGHAEIRVNVVRTAFAAAIAAALADSGQSADTISAVAVTSQAQTWTLLDPDGQAKIDFRTWQDTRAAESCAMLAARLADFEEHCSFGSLPAALQVAQLYHLQQREPNLLQPYDVIVNLPTYLTLLLTGQVVTDTNIAAMSGLYSLATVGWWDQALQACAIEPHQLPRLVSVGTIAAATHAPAAAFGLQPGIPVVLCGNDQTANGFGAGLERSNAALVTLGTAQVVYAYRRELPRAAEHLIRGPYPGGGWYSMVADAVGGSVINWAKTVIAGGASDQDFFDLAAKAPVAADELRFAADLDRGRGQWRNLGFHHGPEHLAKSVVDALAERLGALVKLLELDVTRTPFLVTGGGSMAQPWVNAVDTALGVQLAHIDSSPLIGAARMAANCSASGQNLNPDPQP